MSRLKRLTKKAEGPFQVVGFEADRSGAQWTSIYDAVFTVKGPETKAEILEGNSLKREYIGIIKNWAMENFTTNAHYAEEYISCLDLSEDEVGGMDLDDFYALPPIEQIKNLNDMDEMIEVLLENYGDDAILLVDESGNEIES